MVVGESVELILVVATIIVMYVFILGVEHLTRHEGPPSGKPQSDAKE